MTMKISQLVASDVYMPPEWDREFNEIRCDSRLVTRGDLFIALAGVHEHGKAYIDHAIEQGAVAVIVAGELFFESKESAFFPRVPVFYWPELQPCFATWLARRYPLTEMSLIGVTGTNGKSSVTQYIAQLATRVQQQCALFGTLGNGIWPELEQSVNTTTELSLVRQKLQHYLDAGVNLAALEVSSHGLMQGRVAGFDFAVTIMTNLSQDHLDYHGNMESYYGAKKQLFSEHVSHTQLVNIDDEYGQRLVAEGIFSRLLTYGAHSEASIRYQLLAFDGQSLHAEVTSPWGSAVLVLPLMGEFNVANAVAAIAALASLGFDFATLCAQASTLCPVAGRMELYQKADSPLVVIDFAHTPAALTNVLQAIKPWQRSITTVFGCGGDRDRQKRPLMRAAAEAYSDRVWLTDDNVRFEDPAQIFADALAGAEQTIECQHDRRLAIAEAIAATPANGIVVIAGKGHETYQDIAGVKHPYSDQESIAALGYQAVGGSN